MSEPRTPEAGCAVGEDGQLKDAADIDWAHSPSDEVNAARATSPKSPVPTSIARRTRAKTNANATSVNKSVADKAKSKSNNGNSRKQKGQRKSKPKEAFLELASSSDEQEETPQQTLERLEALGEADRKVTRSKHQRSADIRLIFKPEVRTINGERVKGYVCLICIENPHENQTWYRGGNSSLRTHISRLESHYSKYLDLCQEHNIQPNERALPATANGGPLQATLDTFVKSNPIYTPQRLMEHIIKLVVSDDQAFRLIDKPEFRELIKFLRPNTRENEIPHRTKLREKVLEKGQEVVQNLKVIFKEVKGLVSFTFDTWTSRAGDPYIAVTAHYISHLHNQPMEWTLENTVIGFSFIAGNHGGDNLARIITRAIDRFDLRGKIGWFTSDNASVNDAVMASLTKPNMAAEDILDFDIEDRRVRCAAHVLNLATRAFIEGVAPTPTNIVQKKLSGSKRKLASLYDVETDDEEERLIMDEETPFDAEPDGSEDTEFDIRDLLGKILALIKQIRVSPQARAFFEECCEKKTLKPLQLKKWVRTRWSSMYDLLTRLINLQTAVDFFLQHADRSSKVPKLTGGRTYAMFVISSAEWERLKLISKVLQDPAEAQNAFSSETIPTVWRNIPILEYIQTKWETYAINPQYASVLPGLQRGLKTLQKYYKLTDKTSVNLVCHVLNPSMKMAYIKKKWDAAWIARAQVNIEQVVKSYGQQQSDVVPTENVPASPTEDSAGIKSTGGFASAWMLETIRQSSGASVDRNRSELDDYLNTPPEPDVADILVWWGRHSAEYPTLARVARDYLAIQGSAVASEQCFSSGGLTGTDRRNRLHPDTFEALQILKNTYKNANLFEPMEVEEEGQQEYIEADSDPLIKSST